MCALCLVRIHQRGVMILKNSNYLKSWSEEAASLHSNSLSYIYHTAWNSQWIDFCCATAIVLIADNGILTVVILINHLVCELSII